ncbi:unnamed protein product [Microthlaspi erraticum]|uniref:Uncharacterized protein n=1 Tax=Microthlaspi erraticum TaxID=1685480 RepID=A0A6D2IRB6_9BRAS|nr:unnamed protein product [Microthlaspi erraticum]
MDFIKTSSLRALIELTFQRNWNGLIWMSRKGVITKRVKTVQTALSRISAQPRSPAGRGTNVPRSAKVTSVRLKSRPKSKPTGRSRTTRETLSRGRPSQTPRHTAHDQSARAGKQGLAAAQPVRVPRPMHPSEPGRTSHVRPRISSAKSQSARPRRPTANPSDPDRSDSPRPDCPADRPARPSQRRGRPEALFEAQTYVFKPGLTLAASRKT